MKQDDKIEEYSKLIKEQYPSLKNWSDHNVIILYNSILDEQLIQEFLYTQSSEKTVEQLMKRVNFITPIVIEDNIILRFDLVNKQNLDSVNKFMDSFGWYPSFIGGDMKNSGKYSTNADKFINIKDVDVVYEAKYDAEVSVTNQFLYHLTFDIKYPRIKSRGLTPKASAKISNHPERIYLLDNIDGADLTEFAIALYNKYEYKDKVKEMFLLKIDISQLKDIKFFEDVNFNFDDVEGIWTYQNIPPIYINVDKKIDVTGF